jgi:CRP-like cAMP-binding protein
MSSSHVTSVAVPDDSILAAVPLFAGLDHAARSAVMAAAQLRRVAAGRAVFRQDDEASDFFVLLEGHLKAVQIDSAGRQILIHFVYPNEFFGCVALMEGQRYPASLLAIADSIVLGWSRAETASLLRRHPAVAANALNGFGGRMLEFQTRLRESQIHKADRRIAQALLHLAQHRGRKTECGIAIDFPVTRQDVAEMAGTTLHTASRTIAAWDKQGILSCGRQWIEVTDITRLAMLAQQDDES